MTPETRRRIGIVAGGWLGFLLVLAAIGKAAEPVVFIQQIRNEGLDFWLSGNQVALLALALEAGLGTALLTGVRSWLVLLPTSGLVAFFIFLTGRNYFYVLRGLRDPDYDCGCFGFLWDRTAVEAFWQDLFLMVPALTLALWSRQHEPSQPAPRRLAAGGLAAAVVLGYAVGVAGMPPDLPRAPEGVDRQFSISDDFVLMIDGEAPPEAVLYQSADSLRFVIAQSPLGDPLLLEVIRFEVYRLRDGELTQYSDGTASIDDIVNAGELLGQFSVGAEGISFSFGERRVEVRSRPAGNP